MLFKDGFDDPFRNRLLRCEKKVIDNGVVPISHRQGIGNELEACDRLKSLLICLHDRRVTDAMESSLQKRFMRSIAFSWKGFGLPARFNIFASS